MWVAKSSRDGWDRGRWLVNQIDANSAFHLQLYFFAGVFLAGAWCVSGMVFLRDGMA
jgi:hypothetical protein